MGDWEEFAVQEMGWFGDTEDWCKSGASFGAKEVLWVMSAVSTGLTIFD
jgi:hypothetical protein